MLALLQLETTLENDETEQCSVVFYQQRETQILRYHLPQKGPAE